jgi:hypothetical protein
VSLQNLERLKSTEEKHVKERQGFFDKLKTDPQMPKMFRGRLDSMIGETFENGIRKDVMTN